VLVDDLVTRGVDEPYWLFTSRSEFRLTVRQDNALARLAGIGASLSLYDAREVACIAARAAAVAEARALAERENITPAQGDPLLAGTGTAPLPHAVRIAEVVKRQGVTLPALFGAAGVGGSLPLDAVISAELELKYASYLEKERRAADRLHALGGLRLPAAFDYLGLRTLSMEARQKLSVRRPETVAQAASIPGVTPSDLQNLVIELERRRRARSTSE
jgi:tRNA uridine 5-carboxymethylaminomethyl modification enzyme